MESSEQHEVLVLMPEPHAPSPVWGDNGNLAEDEELPGYEIRLSDGPREWTIRR